MRPSSPPPPRAAGSVFGPPRARTRPGAGIRPAVFLATFAVLAGTNVLTLVAFLMAPDIAALLNGRTDLVYSAYEDRVAQLRLEVDRLHSRQYAQAGDLNLQLQELNQVQEVLLEQHQYVRQLAQRASEMGIQTAALAAGPDAAGADHAALPPASDAASEITRTGELLHQMMDDSRMALAAISTEANGAADEILSELTTLGIRPVLPTGATGGPFIPAQPGADGPGIVDDANAVYDALMRYKAARQAIDTVPVHRPIAGNVRTSSNYGNRKDPFTGRPAFHSGIDFPSATGTTVLSAAAGKVTFAGPKSGYGNTVEVTHAGGLITRYAHLSAILVKAGQTVQTGVPIARVGSTGRSTGPHLHFEVRRDNAPLDPTRFLAAGKRLLRYLSA